MKNPILKTLYELFVGWLIFCLLLMVVSVTWDLFYTREFDAIPRIFPLFGNILYTFIKYTFPGFVVYAIQFLIFTYGNIFKDNTFRTIFNIVLFFVLMLASFIFTLTYLFKLNAINTAVEMQFVFAVATILIAVIPYFKQKLFDPVKVPDKTGQQNFN